MSRKILGLDIRRDSLTAVLVQGTLQGHVIEALAHIQAPHAEEGAESEGEERGERLLRMLETLAQTMDLSTADCLVSFPSIDMSFRNLSVPFRNRKKIRQVLPFELEPVMPGAVDELAMDFIVRERTDEEEESHLISATVNRNLLESFESCLKRGGLSVQAVLPGGSAAAECLIASLEEHEDCLFLDLGQDDATLFLIHGKQIASIRAFAVNNPKAAGLNVNRTALAFGEQNETDYRPTVLYVTGTGAKAHGVHEALAQTTGLVVEPLDARRFMGFGLDERATDLWDRDVYQNAMALCHAGLFGIKGLRLSERFVALNKYLSEYRVPLIQSGVLLLMVLLVLLGNVVYDGITARRAVADYDRRMTAIFREAFPDATKIVNAYSQMKGKVEEARKQSAFADSKAGDIRLIDLLNDISSALPETLAIEFDRFVLGSEDLKISGSTDTFASVEDMKTRLTKIEYFSAVVITSTTGDPGGSKVNFKLKIDF
jgi:type II secretion system protein L